MVGRWSRHVVNVSPEVGQVMVLECNLRWMSCAKLPLRTQLSAALSLIVQHVCVLEAHNRHVQLSWVCRKGGNATAYLMRTARTFA